MPEDVARTVVESVQAQLESLLEAPCSHNAGHLCVPNMVIQQIPSGRNAYSNSSPVAQDCRSEESDLRISCARPLLIRRTSFAVKAV